MLRRLKIYSLVGLAMILTNWYLIDTKEKTVTKTVQQEISNKEATALIDLNIKPHTYDPAKRLFYYEHQETYKVKKSFIPFVYNRKIINSTKKELFSKDL